MDHKKVSNKIKYTYSISSIGRDMAYALFATYLMVFLTNAVGLSSLELLAVTIIIGLARVWDAINDPLMGMIIDNTDTKYGKFKPWLLLGAILSAIFILLMFTDFGLTGTPFIIVFGLLYIFSGMTFTMNDIAYWSMYPSFTTDPKERESIGSLARIFASVGMFLVVALVPLIYPKFNGGPKRGFFFIALFITIIFALSQIIVFFVVKEKKLDIAKKEEKKTKFKDIIKIVFKNDQLVVIIVAILLLNIGYFITTALGLYFFEYDFNKYGGSEFTIFSAVLAVSTLGALIGFPYLAKKISRKKIFRISMIFMLIGYLILMLSRYVLPMNMITLSIGGFFLFSGQGFTQVLVLVMLADTIEYGQWKLGTRNESVIFSVNPFVVKLATAFQTLIVGLTLVVSGMNEKVINPLTNKMNNEFKDLPQTEKVEAARLFISQNMTSQMSLILRMSMIVLPLICILTGYFIYTKYYKIDNKMYENILEDLKARAMLEVEEG